MTVLMLSGAAPALAAQYQPSYQTMPSPTPDADALAADMRILGANPVDLPALLDAADLTLKLGDIDASAAFLTRAERISPSDGRIKAGKARALVQLGRPGEALRLFSEAERYGYPVDNFLAERGLAFDLIGEQERAQRDYRRALKSGPDGETQRRYALSLGISGKRDMALDQIDALLRLSDRAAWRVRAFILAMSGDVSGAERIATSMLPDGMASGLLPFFQLLPSLGPADRAFAVHFGEVRATPERVADARMVPILPTLLPEPVPVVQVAAVAASASTSKQDRKRRRRGKAVEVAMLTPPAVTRPQLPPPPRIAEKMTVFAAPQAVVQAIPAPNPTPTPASPPIQRTQTTPATTSRGAVASVTAPVQPQMDARAEPPPVRQPAPAAVVAVSREAVPAATSTVPVVVLPTSSPATAIAEADTETDAPEAPASGNQAPVALAAAEPVPQPAVEPVVQPVTEAAPVPMAKPPAAVAAKPRPVAAEDSILERIIAGIGVPASELDVSAGAAAPPQPVRPSGSSKSEPKPTPVIDKKAAEKKAALDKAAAEKKIADKKLADEKAAKAKALKADPARAWVQVAGGSSVRDLPKEWSRLRDKAPAAFKGRSAYTTPLRFTNRLLAGPFKSEDEAQGFVNLIAKSGLTGFVFTSEAGQKIDKLPAK